jgi:zinc D-Ala-D-Ala carboxypeptidase
MNPNTALQQLGISRRILAARGLQPVAEATDLVTAEPGDDGRNHLLTPEAAAAWREMKQAAQRDGINLWIISAFRSVDRQFTLVSRKLDSGAHLERVLMVSAPPGYSEHHSGRAVDIGTLRSESLDLSFAATDAFQWLMRRASEFAFFLSYPAGNVYGFEFEPWHWCFRAPNSALQPTSMPDKHHGA